MLIKKISQIRKELQDSNIKKTGKNNHAGFTYYELSDFLPKLNELMAKHEIIDIISIVNGYATLTLTDGKEEKQYSIPFTQFETPKTRSGAPMMQDIQYLGAQNTYYKRYLYLNAFGITDGEIIDSLNNKELPDLEGIIKAIDSSVQKIETLDRLQSRFQGLTKEEQANPQIKEIFSKRKLEIKD